MQVGPKLTITFHKNRTNANIIFSLTEYISGPKLTVTNRIFRNLMIKHNNTSTHQYHTTTTREKKIPEETKKTAQYIHIYIYIYTQKALSLFKIHDAFNI